MRLSVAVEERSRRPSVKDRVKYVTCYFQLSLYSRLAAFSVVGLRLIIVSHHLNELLRQHGMLRLSYTEVCTHHLRLLQLFDALLHVFEFLTNPIRRLLDIRHHVIEFLLDL